MCNSGFLNGMTVQQAIPAAIDYVESKGIGKRKINYRLRDAIFSRQRYWGEPFPIYFKEGVACPMPEDKLPREAHARLVHAQQQIVAGETFADGLHNGVGQTMLKAEQKDAQRKQGHQGDREKAFYEFPESFHRDWQPLAESNRSYKDENLVS